MKKKVSVIFILLAFIITIGCFSGFGPKFKTFADEMLSIKSKSAYLTDYETGTILYAKNENEKLPIASMCKIMTLLVIFDKISDKNITLSVFRYIDKDTCMIRLFNGCNAKKSCTCKVLNKEIHLDFIKYEVKTIILSGDTLFESDSMLIWFFIEAVIYIIKGEK